MNRTIYIYNDIGVAKDSFEHTFCLCTSLCHEFETKEINSVQIRSGSWREDARLLIIPGGADLPYLQKLTGSPNRHIRDFVWSGGSYLGICAGAYYASSYVEFDKGSPIEVLGERELRFFKGTAVGPILAEYDYKSRKGAVAAGITSNSTNAHTFVYYNGGCYFSGTSNCTNTQTLYHYANSLPCIIKTKFGTGITILSGVHFEVDPSKLDIRDPYLQNLQPILMSCDKKRLEVARGILNSLLYFNAYSPKEVREDL